VEEQVSALKEEVATLRGIVERRSAKGRTQG
jgi:hypothetical protein